MPRTLFGMHKKNGSEMRHYKIKKTKIDAIYIYVPGTIKLYKSPKSQYKGHFCDFDKPET